ncbi:hypothetical protein [Larkinella soli]|uniref:hypothetical protein n=1 Tax=Larkinella soli TaxID=1770527 RepID=UPI000FFB2BBB|nr:hypothetical protein [Larkinella soli]
MKLRALSDEQATELAHLLGMETGVFHLHKDCYRISLWTMGQSFVSYWVYNDGEKALYNTDTGIEDSVMQEVIEMFLEEFGEEPAE